MPLAIRPFTAADHGAVMELWCSAWEATYPEIDFRARWPGMLERWEDLVAAGGKAHVATRDGAVCGFILVNPDKAYLDQIAVAPADFGSPTARALMDFAKSLVPGRLALHVNQSNARAVRFYEREGFVRTGEGVNPRSGLPTWTYEWRAAG